VFTTHATILGRTLASNNVNLYKYLKDINPDQEAVNFGIEAKFGIEKQTALNADIFTTVSEITGIEAEHFLGRKPDILLPNGLDMEKFPTFEEASIQHRLMRNKIQQFLLYYFFPYYEFDLSNTLIYFIAGRYEFRDKGVDIFINSLAKLNEKLKQTKSKKTIVAFFWIPADVQAIDPHLLQNRGRFDDIKKALDDEKGNINSKLLFNLIADKEITKETIFSKNFSDSNKRRLRKFKKNGKPEVITHALHYKDDKILRSLYSAGLDNAKDDPVKVVFYPIYLTGSDGLLDLTYYEAMQGSHLGVFPSFYEPWGYTPLEAAALGVSSVTTDLAGFGRYICKECANKRMPGVVVLKRETKTDSEITEDLANFMFSFANFTRHERVKNKLMAKSIAAKADWKNLIKEYLRAHKEALKK